MKALKRTGFNANVIKRCYVCESSSAVLHAVDISGSNLRVLLCFTGSNDALHSPLLQAFILCRKAY